MKILNINTDQVWAIKTLFKILKDSFGDVNIECLGGNKKTGDAWYIGSPDKPGFTSPLDKENLKKYSVR